MYHEPIRFCFSLRQPIRFCISLRQELTQGLPKACRGTFRERKYVATEFTDARRAGNQRVARSHFGYGETFTSQAFNL